MSPRRHLRLVEQPDLFGEQLEQVAPPARARRRWVGKPWGGHPTPASYLAAVAKWTPYRARGGDVEEHDDDSEVHWTDR
jgi:hypothetical protein